MILRSPRKYWGRLITELGRGTRVFHWELPRMGEKCTGNELETTPTIERRAIDR